MADSLGAKRRKQVDYSTDCKRMYRSGGVGQHGNCVGTSGTNAATYVAGINTAHVTGISIQWTLRHTHTESRVRGPSKDNTAVTWTGMAITIDRHLKG